MKKVFLKLLIPLIIIACFALSYISTAQANITIVPKPKKVEIRNYDVILGDNWHILVDNLKDEKKFLASYLEKELLSSYRLSLEKRDASTPLREKYIYLGTIEDSLANEIIVEEQIDISNLTDDESYIIDISQAHIILIAKKPAGIFYGIQSFLQLINIRGGRPIVPASKIIDYPTFKIRGVHILGTKPNEVKPLIDKLVKNKINTLILQSGSYFYLNKPENRRAFKELFDYARKHYIEPIPELSSFGVGADVLSKDPHAAEGIWIQNERYRFENDIAIPITTRKHPLVNVIRCSDSNVIIKSLDRTITYKENSDYKIISGNMHYPYSLDNKPIKILRTPNSNIKNGQVVLLTYDYVEWKAKEADWSIPYCPSSKNTYQVMLDAIRNVINTLKPNFLSIGHDEIRGLNRDSRCKKRNLSNSELIAYEINKLNDSAKTLNPTIRLLMWDDMVNPYHHGGIKNYQLQYGGIAGRSSDALDLIPDDIIIMIWWYDKNDPLRKMSNSPDYFQMKGFDYLGAGYKDKENLKRWSQLIKNKPKSLGIIDTAWDGWQNNIEGIEYTARVGWE